MILAVWVSVIFVVQNLNLRKASQVSRERKLNSGHGHVFLAAAQGQNLFCYLREMECRGV